MFTRDGNTSSFDSVIAVEGTLKRPDVSGEVLVDLVMMYVSKSTGTSYGSCKVTKSLFSKETLILLENFLASAEGDFCRIAFGEGTYVTPEGALKILGSAEDPTGKLESPKSLGGT